METPTTLEQCQDASHDQPRTGITHRRRLENTVKANIFLPVVIWSLHAMVRSSPTRDRSVTMFMAPTKLHHAFCNPSALDVDVSARPTYSVETLAMDIIPRSRKTTLEHGGQCAGQHPEAHGHRDTNI